MRPLIVAAAAVALEHCGVPTIWRNTLGVLGTPKVLLLRNDRALERMGVAADVAYARSLVAFLVRRSDVEMTWLQPGIQVELWPGTSAARVVWLTRQPNLPLWEPADAEGVFWRVYGYSEAD